jgi:hypothetical protein
MSNRKSLKKSSPSIASFRKLTPTKRSAPAAKKAALAKKAAPAKKAPAAKKGGKVAPFRQVLLVLREKGPDAALAHGIKIGLSESQSRSYVKEHTRNEERRKLKEAGLLPTPAKFEAAKAQEPHFRYPSREAAKKALLAQARRCNIKQQAYHILSEGGKYAFVPAYVRPTSKPPQFKKGDVVMDINIGDSRAVIEEAGPEQSVIRYITERKYARKVDTVSNYYLHKISGSKADAAVAKKTKVLNLHKKRAVDAKVAKKAAKKKA